MSALFRLSMYIRVWIKEFLTSNICNVTTFLNEQITSFFSFNFRLAMTILLKTLDYQFGDHTQFLL